MCRLGAGCGWACCLNLMLLLYPVPRSSFLHWLTGTSFPTLIKYHRSLLPFAAHSQDSGGTFQIAVAVTAMHDLPSALQAMRLQLTGAFQGGCVMGQCWLYHCTAWAAILEQIMNFKQVMHYAGGWVMGQC